MTTPNAITGPSGEHLVQRLSGAPMLIDPTRANQFAACIRDLIRHERFRDFMEAPAVSNEDGFWPAAGDWMARYRPYVVVDGVLQIPIMGALINRLGYQIGRYATGYTYIQRALERGLADAGVRGIALIVDSPGGEAAGNFELVDKIFAARSEKPMASFVSDTALSGGFSIATAAPVINITRSGVTGSVGVVTMHVDYSQMLENAGVKVTFIKAGAHKVDGNPYEPLGQGAEERIQGRIDKIYDVFVSTISRNRGMEGGVVRETEALVYDAEESVKIGFADQIGVFEEALSAFENEVADATTDTGDLMTTENTQTEEQSASVSQQDADAIAAAVATARSEATIAERKRFGDVMASDQYVGREPMASKLLTTTDLSASQIVEVLSTAPRTEADNNNAFAVAMDREDNPNVGGDVGETEKTSRSADILSSYRQAGGRTRAA